jgi:C1A family cysteine protease
LDGRALPGEAVLARLRSFLAAGFACALGVPVCSAVTADPDIPFPTVFDRICGGQAMVAVGYDDHRYIRSDRGALLVRNGWGSNWGERGYGYLPYAYIRERLAMDLWTLVDPDWLSSGEFARPE